MTPAEKRLSEIEGRLAHVKDTRWLNAYPNAGQVTPMPDHVWSEHKDLIARGLNHADAKLIAASPTDLAALCKALRTALAALKSSDTDVHDQAVEAINDQLGQGEK